MTPGASTGESFVVAGLEAAPAIVFVHGTRLTRASWAVQIAALNDTYRVIAMDLPGHGSLADRPFTLADAADELARVIEVAEDGVPWSWAYRWRLRRHGPRDRDARADARSRAVRRDPRAGRPVGAAVSRPRLGVRPVGAFGLDDAARRSFRGAI